MPVGIFLFEIDKSFGPKIIADFYLSSQKVTPDALKELSEKHKKDLLDATYKTNKFRYYSSIVDEKSLKEKVYLGFILKLEEDVVSLKSVFESIERRIVENFTRDKKKMEVNLKDTLSSILSLMEKLKEPKIIQEKINEKTKILLDEGKLQEARELISLGEKIPKQLSATVRSAEDAFRQQLYKKAKKNYLKAADLAGQIEETEMVEILTKKGETVGDIPIYLKERDTLNKEIKKILGDLEVRHLNIAYKNMITSIDENIKISNKLEDNELIELLEELKVKCHDALQSSLSLANADKDIKDLIKNI
jgi:protease II